MPIILKFKSQLQLAVAAVGLLVCLGPATVQAQDANKALSVFQSLMRQGQPTQTAPAGAPQAARGTDLVQLLSQSLEQIDEPREIQPWSSAWTGWQP